MARKKKFLVDRAYLQEKYVKHKMSSQQIADELGCACSTANRLLKESGIALRSQGYHKVEDIRGEIFGRWTVIDRGENTKQGYSRWISECECGTRRLITQTALKNGTRKRCSICAHKAQRGREELSKTIWGQIARGAKIRGLELSITKEEAYAIFLKQNRRCALTGIKLKFAESVRLHNAGETTASLDRINSKLGYKSCNIQWVHKEINIMKMDKEEEAFVRWCELVANHKNQYGCSLSTSS